MTAVAIDGPAGAGKSTVARAVARELGWEYLDTGAMYRAVTLGALERGISPEDATSVAELIRSIPLEPRGDAVYLDGRDVSDAIREDRVTQAVSTVAAHPEVRAELVALQRALAARETW